MRNFEFTLRGEIEAENQTQANEVCEAMLSELLGADSVVYDTLTYNAAIMPKDYREPIASRAVDTVEAVEEYYGPQHPWDAGASIFPVDHPYRIVEDAIRDVAESSDIFPRHQVQEALKQLPPPSDD